MTPTIRSPKAAIVCHAQVMADAAARCIASQVGYSKTWQDSFDSTMRRHGFVYNPNGPCFPHMDTCEFGHHPACGWEVT
jgi:hypothetical protein